MDNPNRKAPYTLVLTHDVDNLSLRCHPLLSTATASFFKRCLYNNFLRTLKKDIPPALYLNSVKWCLFYPFVKTGLKEDPWEKIIFDIMELEKSYGARSTFFFIPYPDRPGHIKPKLPAPRGRAASYDLRRYGRMLEEIVGEGWEVGVHGIDAHLSSSNALEELSILRGLLPDREKIGIRMHWLYQTEQFLKYLKEAGYYYDTSYCCKSRGVPFGDSRSQPFKNDDIWVLPLNIHDSMLLGHWRLGMSMEAAWREIESTLEKARNTGAVVTILWHTSTSTVYSFWGVLYERILRRAKEDGARMMRCVDLCDELELKEKPLGPEMMESRAI